MLALHIDTLVINIACIGIGGVKASVRRGNRHHRGEMVNLTLTLDVREERCV